MSIFTSSKPTFDSATEFVGRIFDCNLQIEVLSLLLEQSEFVAAVMKCDSKWKICFRGKTSDDGSSVPSTLQQLIEESASSESSERVLSIHRPLQIQDGEAESCDVESVFVVTLCQCSLAFLSESVISERASKQFLEKSLQLFLLAVLRLKAISREQELATELEEVRGEGRTIQRELNTYLHDANNRLQEIMTLCGKEAGEESKQLFLQIEALTTALAAQGRDVRILHELAESTDLTPREQVAVCEVISEVVQGVSVIAGERKISLRVENAAVKRVVIQVAAREYLETLLREFLRWSLKATPIGGQVCILVEVLGENLALSICDQSHGFSSVELRRLISGVEVNPAWVRLSFLLRTLKQLIVASGGSLNLDSAGANSGLKLQLTLPCREGKELSVTSSGWALLVDDKSELTSFYAKVANACHIEPVEALNCTAARRALAERGNLPAFIVTDLVIGEEDGTEFVEFIRKNVSGSIPIIVVSGQEEDGVRERVLEAGADIFLQKPVSHAVLFERFREIVSRGGT